MKIKPKHIILWFVVLLLQILVFNPLNVSGYINPYVYPLLIILLPFNMAGWLLLILAACLGLFIDVFTGTLGMHLFALVFMAGLRPNIAKILSLSKQEPGAYINIKQHGLIVSATFIGVLLFIHHIVYFLLETFASSGLSYGLLRTFASLFFSIFISMILLLVINPGRNER